MYLIRIHLYKEELINADNIEEDLISICDSAATCSAVVHSFLTYIKDYTDENLDEEHSWASELPLVLQENFSANWFPPSFTIKVDKIDLLTVESDIPAIVKGAMFDE